MWTVSGYMDVPVSWSSTNTVLSTYLPSGCDNANTLNINSKHQCISDLQNFKYPYTPICTNYIHNPILSDYSKQNASTKEPKYNTNQPQRIPLKNTIRAKHAPLSSWSPFSVKLWINRIPKNIADGEIAVIFAVYGTILELFVDRDSNSIYGTAFVRYASLDGAIKAVNELHGKYSFLPETTCIQVRYANGELERLQLPADFHPSGEAIKVFIGNLDISVDEKQLYCVFDGICSPVEIYVVKNSGKCNRGAALVTFATLEGAQTCIKLLDKKIVKKLSQVTLLARLAISRAAEKKKQKRKAIAINHDIEVCGTVTPSDCRGNTTLLT